MTSEKAFQLYFALRLYYTSGFDVFTYGTNFKGKAEVSARKDFTLINPIMKFAPSERELIECCVANNLYNNPDFLYNHDWAEENYKHWCKVKDSLTHTFSRDLDTIEFHMLRKDCTLDDYLSNQVISDLLSGTVEYESLILLDMGLPCINRISGFDSDKYKARMCKSAKFVNKGTLGHRHLSRIDSFKQNMKGSHNGNISIATA
jgi:hypothetical protein